VAALAILWLVCGCASLYGSSARYGWFGTPDRRDPWTGKIRGWQARERADVPVEALPASGPSSVSGPARGTPLYRPGAASELRRDYERFRAERKRELARDAARWIQKQARLHYVEDGAVDHWATTEETLRRGAEDCDGLELLVYHFLREHGFATDEVYRAIVYRPRDGQHHMVTLWFEDRDDPWVIDPTGAMTSGMPRMSQVPGWVPLKVFTERREYTVRPRTDSLRPQRTAVLR
jgi:hypothetical protein